jgi:hypothetical protein
MTNQNSLFAKKVTIHAYKTLIVCTALQKTENNSSYDVLGQKVVHFVPF